MTDEKDKKGKPEKGEISDSALTPRPLSSPDREYLGTHTPPP